MAASPCQAGEFWPFSGVDRRPFFIGLRLLFLGLDFRKLYLVPQVCDKRAERFSAARKIKTLRFSKIVLEMLFSIP